MTWSTYSGCVFNDSIAVAAFIELKYFHPTAYTVKMTTHLSKALEEDNERLGGSRKTPNVRAKRWKSNAFVEVLLLFYHVVYVVSSKDMQFFQSFVNCLHVYTCKCLFF